MHKLFCTVATAVLTCNVAQSSRWEHNILSECTPHVIMVLSLVSKPPLLVCVGGRAGGAICSSNVTILAAASAAQAVPTLTAVGSVCPFFSCRLFKPAGSAAACNHRKTATATSYTFTDTLLYLSLWHESKACLIARMTRDACVLLHHM